MLNVAKCPTCGTEFEATLDKDGKAVAYPWNSQKQHCTKHDMVYPGGGECPACRGEKDAGTFEDTHAGHTASETPKEHKQALDDAVAKAKENAKREQYKRSSMDVRWPSER
jgi:hypothetical protein